MTGGAFAPLAVIPAQAGTSPLPRHSGVGGNPEARKRPLCPVIPAQAGIQSARSAPLAVIPA